jgi:predicted CxxxxCH...CXXCH cytochrome family protein
MGLVLTRFGLAAIGVAALAACALERVGPAAGDSVHPAGMATPSSPAFHGASLRAARWAPMLDANDPDACGRCHDGAPARPSGVAFGAPGAPACTACHAAEGGALACGTCHGDGAGDPAPTAGAHGGHVRATATHASGFSCDTCHPVPGDTVVAGTHADGVVEIAFGVLASAGGASASWAPDAHACAVACHDRGGAVPRPAWPAGADAGALGCGDCHRAPPDGHFAGPCTGCHPEADVAGTALRPGPLHLNGRIDVGDGSGLCGACHGAGDDPWPRTAAHAAHRAPTLAAPIACASCHPVPSSILSPGHMNGRVDVVFREGAVARGAAPVWDGARCAGVACHGANLPERTAEAPAWSDGSHAARACGTCHGLPPTIDHTTSSECDRVECHGGEVRRDATGLSIPELGLPLHVNGVIDVAR